LSANLLALTLSKLEHHFRVLYERETRAGQSGFLQPY